jgi:DNA-binding NarL/FixJ family response regulator
MTVLIVDDERHVRSEIRMALDPSMAGAIIEAADAESVDNLVGCGSTIDLAIIDLILPGMDGLDLVARLKSKGVNILRFLLLIDWRPTPLHEDEFYPSPDAILLKPLQPTALREVVLHAVQSLTEDAPSSSDSALSCFP